MRLGKGPVRRHPGPDPVADAGNRRMLLRPERAHQTGLRVGGQREAERRHQRPAAAPRGPVRTRAPHPNVTLCNPLMWQGLRNITRIALYWAQDEKG